MAVKSISRVYSVAQGVTNYSFAPMIRTFESILSSRIQLLSFHRCPPLRLPSRQNNSADPVSPRSRLDGLRHDRMHSAEEGGCHVSGEGEYVSLCFDVDLMHFYVGNVINCFIFVSTISINFPACRMLHPITHYSYSPK